MFNEVEGRRQALLFCKKEAKNSSRWSLAPSFIVIASRPCGVAIQGNRTGRWNCPERPRNERGSRLQHRFASFRVETLDAATTAHNI
jgi:hypothetical protein